MATEILRPSAPGDETNLTPNDANNWDMVDEVSADEATTYVKSTAVQAYQRDLYNLPASSGSGTINFIKIYIRTRNNNEFMGYEAKAKPSLKSNTTVTDGTEIDPISGSWTTYSQQWNTNPADSQPWDWADIDALQIGISLKGDGATFAPYCTQVYVEVDSTIPAPRILQVPRRARH